MGLQWQRYVYSNCLLISGTLVTDPLTVWSACLIDLNDLSDLTDSVTHPNNHLPIITHIFTHSLLDRWDLLIWNAQSVGNWLSLPPLCAWRELSISFFSSCNSFSQLLINHSDTSDLSSDGTRECRMVFITMRRSSGMLKHSSLAAYRSTC